MIHPDEYRHAPGSIDGCVIYVKLKQLGAPPTRNHLRITTPEMQWERIPSDPTRSVKQLFTDEDEGGPIRMRMERWDNGARIEWNAQSLTELLLLRGSARVAYDGEGEEKVLDALSWVRIPVNFTCVFTASEECEWYVREGEWRRD